MSAKLRLAVPDALYVQPLLFGLNRQEALFETESDIGARNALKLAERTGNIRCAFLSPIDFARHGGEYSIVPGICASSAGPTGTVRLYVKERVSRITSVAADIRLTTELVLTKIIVKERYSDRTGAGEITFIPMEPSLDAMLRKADAALVLESFPGEHELPGHFALDLADEWLDMTDLPYVHGFWVARDEDLEASHIQGLIDAAVGGTALRHQMAEAFALQRNASIPACRTQIDQYSYTLGDSELESVSELFRLAFFHGVIGDVPDVNLFDDPTADRATSLN